MGLSVSIETRRPKGISAAWKYGLAVAGGFAFAALYLMASSLFAN